MSFFLFHANNIYKKLKQKTQNREYNTYLKKNGSRQEEESKTVENSTKY